MQIVTVQLETDNNTDAEALVAALAQRGEGFPVQLTPPTFGTARNIRFVSAEPAPAGEVPVN